MSNSSDGDESVKLSDTSEESIFNFETFIQIVKKFILFLILYSIGYYGLSIFWAYLFGVLVILNYKWKREKREKTQAAQAMALGFEQEIILNTLPQPPSWVRFPTVEKVEWANRLCNHVWGLVNQYAQELVPKLLEPAIQRHVADFKFEQVVLGNVPIRIDSVQVFDQENRNKVVMDIDVSYAGDCYVTFQTFKFTGGIKDIQLHGRLRIVLTPLISKLPVIGGLQIYFMNEPRINFDLIKMTHILDVPVIRNKIQSTTMKVINSLFLFPNVFSIKLNKRVQMSKLSVFKVDGILRVHVVEAQNLVNKDLIGKSDPYVVLNLGSVKKETSVIHNCLNPKWDYWCEFESEANSELQIHVWDRDEGIRDETLGHTSVDVALIAKNKEANWWKKLEGVHQGTVHIRLTWLDFSTNYQDLDTALKETEMLSPLLHTALLMVYLDSASDLPMISKSLPNPFVDLRVEDCIKSSDVEKCTCGPIWEKGYTLLIKDPRKAVLDVRVWDEESKHLLGSLCYKIENLKEYPLMEIRRQSFFLNQSNSKASITFSLQLKIFKSESIVQDTTEDKPVESRILTKQNSTASTSSKTSLNSVNSEPTVSSVNSDDTENGFSLSFDPKGPQLGTLKLSVSYSVQRQKLIVTIHELDLPLSTSSNLLDIYVKVYLETNKAKTIKKKTNIVKDSYSPIFDETFEYLISAKDLNFSKLIVEAVIDKSILSFGKKSLGKVMIALDRSDNLDKPYTNWFNLVSKSARNMYHLN